MTTEHMKQLFIFVFSVLALISCDSGTDLPEAIMEPVAAEVTARIGPVSRAAGTDWAENDRIGISGVSGSKTYANVEYRIADAAPGEFTAVGNPACSLHRLLSFYGYRRYGASLHRRQYPRRQPDRRSTARHRLPLGAGDRQL